MNNNTNTNTTVTTTPSLHATHRLRNPIRLGVRHSPPRPPSPEVLDAPVHLAPVAPGPAPPPLEGGCRVRRFPILHHLAHGSEKDKGKKENLKIKPGRHELEVCSSMITLGLISQHKCTPYDHHDHRLEVPLCTRNITSFGFNIDAQTFVKFRIRVVRASSECRSGTSAMRTSPWIGFLYTHRIGVCKSSW